jgi:hypothetical protein
VLDDGDVALSEPNVLIELVGQTKGPLRWFEDYQATVRYMQIDAQGSVNAFTLVGTDNGQPERRHIVFYANRLPEVRLFDDSTASEALTPQSDWLGNTFNPLEVLKKMLLAAARQKSCEADFWGYDGKRRYRLTSRDMTQVKGPAPSNGADTMRPEVTADDYICELTMYAEGRQSVTGQTANSSFLARKFAALWPFNDGDRRMTFVIRAQPIPAEKPSFRLVLTDIRIHVGVGAITGSSAP